MPKLSIITTDRPVFIRFRTSTRNHRFIRTRAHTQGMSRAEFVRRLIAECLDGRAC